MHEIGFRIIASLLQLIHFFACRLAHGDDLQRNHIDLATFYGGEVVGQTEPFALFLAWTMEA